MPPPPPPSIPLEPPPPHNMEEFLKNAGQQVFCSNKWFRGNFFWLLGFLLMVDFETNFWDIGFILSYAGQVNFVKSFARPNIKSEG